MTEIIDYKNPLSILYAVKNDMLEPEQAIPLLEGLSHRMVDEAVKDTTSTPAVLDTAELIKHMVDKFLQWKLPEDFHPDAGISFKPTYNEHTQHPAKYQPVGTNLFTATQATEMVKYMLDGLPDQTQYINSVLEGLLGELPEKPGLHIVAEMDNLKEKTKGLHPNSNAYQEIQREHLMNMGIKAGKAYILDQVTKLIKGAMQ